MAWREDLDRTLELPAEPLDDLAPLESKSSPSEPRPDRVQTVTQVRSLDESAEQVESVPSITDATDREIDSELASRRLSIARREQRHRHALEMAELRHRHDGRRQRVQQEARILGALLVLVVTSGLAWLAMPVADAAQIVFTTSFGVAVGYLGGRARRGGLLRG